MLNSILLEQAGSAGGGIGSLLMIVAMVVIFYFFMIRPQQKKQKDLKKQREALQAGDRVITAGGIHGKIKEVKDTSFVIEVAPNVSIKVDKNSVFAGVEDQKAAQQK